MERKDANSTYKDPQPGFNLLGGNSSTNRAIAQLINQKPVGGEYVIKKMNAHDDDEFNFFMFIC